MMRLTNISEYEIIGNMSKCLYPNAIKDLRKLNKLTQEDIGKVWGVERGDVSRIENGIVALTYVKCRQLKEAYGWTASMVFGDIDPEILVPARFLMEMKNDIDEVVRDSHAIRNRLKVAASTKSDA